MHAGGCTLFQVVLALWSALLCRHAVREEGVVGSPYHGRDAAGTEQLIGYFVNMLALRVEVPRRGGSVGLGRRRTGGRSRSVATYALGRRAQPCACVRVTVSLAPGPARSSERR